MKVIETRRLYLRELRHGDEDELKKGIKIYVEGRLRTRSWQDKENNTRCTTEIIADAIHVVNWNDGNSAPAQEKTVYPINTPPTEPSPAPPTYNFEDDDELPF